MNMASVFFSRWYLRHHGEYPAPLSGLLGGKRRGFWIFLWLNSKRHMLSYTVILLESKSTYFSLKYVISLSNNWEKSPCRHGWFLAQKSPPKSPFFPAETLCEMMFVRFIFSSATSNDPPIDKTKRRRWRKWWREAWWLAHGWLEASVVFIIAKIAKMVQLILSSEMAIQLHHIAIILRLV